jgi:YbbR domain-containing protein
LLIQQVKEIPVVFNPIYGGGTTASNTTIKSSVNNIEVAGREEQLSRLDEINLGDIDLGAIEVNNNVLTYELTDYLPDGVTVVSGEEQITVTITFPELASKSVTVTQFRYKNLPEGMSAEFVTKQMSVVVRGKEYELKWLTDSNVVVWVDLANAKLGMDDYSVTFEIVKNSDSKDFETLGVMTCTQKVTVRLTEAPAA